MSFHHLFLLPIELVRSTVIPKLRLRDLSRVDDATTNKHARVEFIDWIRGFPVYCRLTSSTKPSFLKWIVARDMKIDILQTVEDTEATLLQQLDGTNLVVDHFFHHHSHNPLGTSVVDHLLTLKSLNNFHMYTIEGFDEISTWNKLLRRFPNLQALYLETDYRGAPEFKSHLIETVANHCHLLTALSMHVCSGVHDASVVFLARLCPLLKSLELQGCSALGDASLQSLGQNCPQLTSLNISAKQGSISDVGLVPLLQGCIKLKSVELWDCSHITVHSMVVLAPISAQLEYLILPGCRVFGAGTATAAKSLRKLRSLILASCTGISEDLLITIIANNPGLWSVTLDGGSTVTNRVLVAIGRCCPSLHWISLTECPLVSELTALCASPYFQFAKLSDCSGVTGDTLLALAATPGRFSITVRIDTAAQGAKISPVALQELQGSARVRVEWM